MSMIWVGILLEICAASLGTISKQLIAYSEHVKKRWLFHIGAGINMIVGPAVDASAYAFAPQVVVAPFACLDVIFNTLSAPYTLKWQNERITKAHIAGTILVAAGAVFTAVFGAEDGDEKLTVHKLEAQLKRPASLFYMGAEVVLVLIAWISMQAQIMTPTSRGIALGVMAGALMGNVFFLKGIVSIVRDSFETGNMEAWNRLTPYLCLFAAVLGAVLGHMLLRMGLGEYKGVYMVTIFEGAHITAACLSGVIVLSEMAHMVWWKQLLYWLSLFVLVAGILVINTAAGDSHIAAGGQKAFHVAETLPGSAGTDKDDAVQRGSQVDPEDPVESNRDHQQSQSSFARELSCGDGAFPGVCCWPSKFTIRSQQPAPLNTSAIVLEPSEAPAAKPSKNDFLRVFVAFANGSLSPAFRG